MILEVGANEIASANKFTVELFSLIIAFAVIPIRYTLPQRRLVIHFPDSLNQIVIELLNPHRHATSLRPPHVLAGFLGQVLPPLSEASELNSGNALPFHWVGILWARR